MVDLFETGLIVEQLQRSVKDLGKDGRQLVRTDLQEGDRPSGLGAILEPSWCSVSKRADTHPSHRSLEQTVGQKRGG